MALSPTDAWYEAVTRDGARIRMLVEIYDGTNTWKAVSGSMDPGSDLHDSDIPVAISAVAPLGVELNPLTRATQIKAMFVDVADAWLRPIVVNYQIDKQRLTVKLGAAELSESDFVAVFVGSIENVVPTEDPKIVKIEALDLIASLGRNHITGYWYNVHPLEALYDGAGNGILEKGGIVDFVTATFDHTDVAYADIENVLVSRTDTSYVSYAGYYASVEGVTTPLMPATARAVREPTPALDLSNGICGILNSHLDFDESGSVRVVRYNPGSSNLDTWTDDDFVPETFRQISSGGDNITNRVIWRFGEKEQVYQADDTASQVAYAFPGASERVESLEITTPWLDAEFWLSEDLTDVAAAFPLHSPNMHSLSGNRADMTIDAASPLYLLLIGFFPEHYTGDTREIVKATTLTMSTAISSDVVFWVPGVGYVKKSIASAGTVSNVTRNWPDGPPGIGHESIYGVAAYDITLPVIISDLILARFKNGCPIVECRTLGLEKFVYQIGDFVGLKVQSYLGYGEDGLDGTEKWEIIGKEGDPLAQDNSIKWVLALVRDDGLTRTAGIDFLPRRTDEYERIATNESVTQAIADTGLAVTQDALLDGKISAGFATDGTVTSGVASEITHAFTASMDTYVSLDMRTSALMFRELALGDPAPTIPSSELPLAKVVTDAVEITDIDSSITKTLPIVGSKLEAGTGPLAKVSQLGFLDNLTSVTTRVIDSLTDATYARPLAASLSAGKVDLAAGAAGLANQLPAPQLGTASVTTVKVAENAIGPYQAIGSNVGGNFNADVGVFSLGSGFVPDKWRII